MDVTFCVMYPDNEKALLGDCIGSLPKSAEIIVMETVPSESGFGTELIKQEGNIFYYKWTYKKGEFKFNEARNTIKSLATRGWVFHIDNDERFCSHQAFELDYITRTAPKELGGFVVASFHYYPCFGTATPPLVQKSIANMLKLHRNVKEFEWYNEIHEDIYDSIIANGYVVVDSGFLLNHYGYRLTIDKMLEKSIRNKEAFEKYNHLLDKPHFKKQYEDTCLQINQISELLGLKHE